LNGEIQILSNNKKLAKSYFEGLLLNFPPGMYLAHDIDSPIFGALSVK